MAYDFRCHPPFGILKIQTGWGCASPKDRRSGVGAPRPCAKIALYWAPWFKGYAPCLPRRNGASRRATSALRAVSALRHTLKWAKTFVTPMGETFNPRAKSQRDDNSTRSRALLGGVRQCKIALGRDGSSTRSQMLQCSVMTIRPDRARSWMRPRRIAAR